MHKVTMIAGDGIGPEISDAVAEIIAAAGVEINWDKVEAGAGVMEKYGTPLPEEVFKSIRKNRVALKGPITTPVGSGFRSVNVAIRKELNLYANVRPLKVHAKQFAKDENIDMVVFRENTEGLYVGIEHYVGDQAAESIKIITRKASRKITERAFEYAVREGRKKVTAVHKANILKFSDGLFLEEARKVAAKYKETHPEIEFDDKIVDNMCMQMVQYPEQYDVLVMPNLYGDIVSDLGAGLIGGLGLAPGMNLGDDLAVFEAVHGSAPDIAGQNKANPVALLFSAVLMLKHLGETKAADRIETAVSTVLNQGEVLTGDLGGTASTDQITAAIISEL
ncbi:isocitrate dehydrogenase (NAD+) [Halanaerobium saccharolyticum]|uniref:Isocitrate dehydrogenase (NAD+) n=1 Tax=Halanaerobium saccharolyticum TaxID=43595 RepID=A0A4R7Z7W0_9FIRM|nr:isocitrate/isopropylmalate dehydrogenase family protein [Halanaerobium saccharolyticum]RAK08635.1 isocitrate dehydrogenase (NAD+) [Halanaerobium saccharolyticum]TDW07222.1 isocitrate dehydrogenase (NAD+) [Halanaerobium saccharolyticum]TDX60187.1 isocitrate dehydrogenase (NAD+) [Halanaerobium saccharolyticum]